MGLLGGADQCSSPSSGTALVSPVGRVGCAVCEPMVRITPCLGLGSQSKYLKIGYSFTSCVR